MPDVQAAIKRIMPQPNAIWGDEGAIKFLRRVVSEPISHLSGADQKAAAAAQDKAQTALNQFKVRLQRYVKYRSKCVFLGARRATREGFNSTLGTRGRKDPFEGVL